jgi:hypothetical protein
MGRARDAAGVRCRRSSAGAGSKAGPQARSSPLAVLGKVAAAPIPDDLLAVLPPEQEIDGTEKTTLADEV